MNNDDAMALMLDVASARGLEIGEPEVDQLRDYVARLLDWNKRHNLISRADTAAVWTKHILHSLSPLMFLRLPEACLFADVGTGGGLPGIPLAIVRWKWSGVLIESIAKKADAVGSIVDGLGLSNVTVVHARAEDPGATSSWRARCDLVVARAVAPLARLAEWSRPLLKRHGKEGELAGILVALKGGELTNELRELRRSHPRAEVTVQNLEFPPPTGLIDKKLITVQFADPR